MTIAVAGFQANTSHLVSVKRRADSSFSRILNLQHTSNNDDAVTQYRHGISSNLDLIRPVLVSAAAATFILSMPSASHAVDVLYPNTNKEVVMHSSSISALTHQPPVVTTLSSFQVASSTMATPIGEMQDGSEASAATSFGQWFFLIYVVVSLLAGGKEVLSRIQKQMDKDS